MGFHWLLPGSVLLGSVIIALAIIGPTNIGLGDAGAKARRECESLMREAFPDLDRDPMALRCIMTKGGLH